MLNTILNGVNDGLLWAIFALGLYISYRVLDIADLTCEGAMTLGASSVTSVLTAITASQWFGNVGGENNFAVCMLLSLLCVLISTLAGVLAGIFTGILYTKFKIPPILAGILTMCSLYTINIWIMGSASLSLPFSLYDNLRLWLKESGVRITGTALQLIINAPLCLGLVAVLYWFFGTELGSAVRATGSNPQMCRAQGINTDMTTIIGLGLGNGLIALSGALQVQTRFSSEVNMGAASIVIGLAAIVIGEALFSRFKNFFVSLLGIVAGSVLYRIIVSVVIEKSDPTALKLVSAVIVVLALSAPRFIAFVQKKIKNYQKKHGKKTDTAPQLPEESVVVNEEVTGDE